jgi:hypothetical protein
MTPEEKLKLCLERHPDWSDCRVTKTAKGATVAMVRAMRAGLPMPENRPNPAPTAVQAAQPGLISVADLRFKLDVKAAILRTIKDLPPGQVVLENELALTVAGSDRNKFRRIVENNADVFKPLRVSLRVDGNSEGRWHWGKAEDIAELERLKLG